MFARNVDFLGKLAKANTAVDIRLVICCIIALLIYHVWKESQGRYAALVIFGHIFRILYYISQLLIDVQYSMR